MTSILTAEQLAEILQIKAETVRRMTRAGTIPYHRLTGGTIRYHLEEILADSRVSNHVDDQAIDDLAKAMHTRMEDCRKAGKDGWEDCPVDQLWALLDRASGKRSAVDVANYAAMIFAQEKARGASGLNV